MGRHLDDFHQRMERAIMPPVKWTVRDSRSLWNTPFLEWGDYFSLKSLKKKVSVLNVADVSCDDLKAFVKPYVRSVNKKNARCLDYLYAFGDIVLREMVQMHLEKKFGKDSPKLEEFMQKEEVLWEKVIKMRHRRKFAFLQKELARHFQKQARDCNALQLQNYLEQSFECEDRVEFGLQKKAELEAVSQGYVNTRFQKMSKSEIKNWNNHSGR